MSFKRPYLLFFLVIISALSCNNNGGTDEEPIEAPLGPGEVAGYSKVDHQGFVIQVQDIGLSNYASVTNEALEKVKADLTAIVDDYELPSAVLDSLQSMTIFIDWSSSFGGTARFHASRNWLVNNGYILDKLYSIEVSNVGNFLHHTELNMPNLLLHEIAHLYHLTTLTTNYEPIYQAYLHARENNLYSSVSYHVGNGNYVEGVFSPAVSDQLNYFAELTEAYFGLNEYYPFNREQLKEHDPQGFAVLEAVWKE